MAKMTLLTSFWYAVSESVETPTLNTSFCTAVCLVVSTYRGNGPAQNESDVPKCSYLAETPILGV